LIAVVGAVALAFSLAAQAAGSLADPTATQQAERPDREDARVTVLHRSAKRFHHSVEIARRKAKRDEVERASDSQAAGQAPAAGSIPSPESVGVSSATLESIAACESGGDPTAVSADGSYHGKYQFDLGTWASVGGSGDPAAAPEAEQDYRAALLYSRGGSSPWPVCGA
jgi:hypothetical protein